jgi:hypothetical protein
MNEQRAAENVAQAAADYANDIGRCLFCAFDGYAEGEEHEGWCPVGAYLAAQTSAESPLHAELKALRRLAEMVRTTIEYEKRLEPCDRAGYLKGLRVTYRSVTRELAELLTSEAPGLDEGAEACPDSTA